MDVILVSDLHVDCVVGCNADERDRPQPVVVNLQLHLDAARAGATDALDATVNYALVAKGVTHYCEAAECYTLEALATGIAHQVFAAAECALVGRVVVRIDKPRAFRRLPAVPGVQLARDRSFFVGQPPPARVFIAATPLAAAPAAEAVFGRAGGGLATVYLAVGSNLGDRYDNIMRALALLTAPPPPHTLSIARTSFLYETPPAYVTDQPPFLNAALEAATDLPPRQLLAHIKQNVERALGRPVGADAAGAVRFGPRTIDVDIVAYADGRSVDDGDELTVPHPRAAERDFVLGPLADVAPALSHPRMGGGASVGALLSRLVGAGGVRLQRVLPLPRRDVAPDGAVARGPTLLLPLGGRTHVMGVLNVTPDSFSDGGRYDGVRAAVAAGVALAAAGAAVVDVGGQSTRPGATAVSADEEAARVLPVIAALRAALPPSAAVSVDTFHATVARRAVAAGASLINDVSAGTRDAGMLAVAAELQVPICLMHTRGTPADMASLATYGDGDVDGSDGAAVVPVVAEYLATRATAAQAAGVPRWAVVLDPGLGFAKAPRHSFALLRRGAADAIAAACGGARFPLLYGPSRKGFIGAVTGKPAGDREWGTAAAVTAAVAAGADVVRVHDAGAMADVVAVADAVFRARTVP